MKPFVSVYLSSFAALLLGALPAFEDCVSGNCQDGIGKMTYTDGGEYEGSFKQGYRDGQGTYTWGNKTKYTGNWERGDQNGQGSLYDAEGKVTFAGTWNRGQQVAVALNAAGTPVQSGCVSGN